MFKFNFIDGSGLIGFCLESEGIEFWKVMFVVIWENCVGISVIGVVDIRYVKLYGGFVFVYGLFVYGECFKVGIFEG